MQVYVNENMNRLETLVEKKIREAMEDGEFDNLPGKGQPVDTSENPFEDPDLRTVHRLLRNAGFAPAFIEERKDIDATLEKSRQTLKRAWELHEKSARSDSRSAEANWQRVVEEFHETVAELNERIRIYNLKVPAGAFQRRRIDARVEIERVRKT